MINLFDKTEVNKTLQRINALNEQSTAQWGKMSVAQMLAHLNVAYEMAYENKHPKPNFIARFFIKLFVKDMVVGNKPYKKNSPTAPAFKMTESKNFYHEKDRLIAYLQQTQSLGESHFDGRESLSFGKLSAVEWNTMFAKHIDYHLGQFGV